MSNVGKTFCGISQHYKPTVVIHQLLTAYSSIIFIDMFMPVYANTIKLGESEQPGNSEPFSKDQFDNLQSWE